MFQIVKTGCSFNGRHYLYEISGQFHHICIRATQVSDLAQPNKAHSSILHGILWVFDQPQNSTWTHARLTPRALWKHIQTKPVTAIATYKQHGPLKSIAPVSRKHYSPDRMAHCLSICKAQQSSRVMFSGLNIPHKEKQCNQGQNTDYCFSSFLHSGNSQQDEKHRTTLSHKPINYHQAIYIQCLWVPLRIAVTFKRPFRGARGNVINSLSGLVTTWKSSVPSPRLPSVRADVNCNWKAAWCDLTLQLWSPHCCISCNQGII